MFKNYIKIAWRNLVKDKVFTWINSIGLISGIAITLLIISYVNYEMSYENMHPNSAKISRLTVDFMEGNTVTTQDVETYPAVAEVIKDDVPEIEFVARAYPVDEPNTTIIVDNKKFIVKDLLAVDPEFFTMFNYPFLYGSIDGVFKQPNEVVLTKSTALSYFNKPDVIGELIKSPGYDKEMLLKVVGVIPDSPTNTHLKFDMLVSYQTMYADAEMQERHGEKLSNWDGNNSYTYVQLYEDADYDSYVQSVAAFSQRLNDEKKIEGEQITTQPIEDIHLHSQKTFEPEVNGDYKSVMFLLGVAFLIIFSALINYINLTTSKALERAREVGVKKIMGSSRSQLATQFLTESFLLTLLSGVVALGVIALCKPVFINISGLPEGFEVFNIFSFWIYFVLFVVVGSLLSGIYPAMVLSSFEPLAVLRGKFSHSARGLFLRKSLVVFQFAITIILLIQTFTVNEQINYLRDIDIGVEVDNTIVVEAPSQASDQKNYSSFKDVLLADSSVKQVSLSHSVPGQDIGTLSTTAGIYIKGAETENRYNFYLTFIDDNYFDLLDIPVIAGKNFKKNDDLNKGEVVVNEESLSRWNINSPEEAIGQVLTYWGRDWTIIGVVANYHQQSPKAPYLPMIHMIQNSFRSLAAVQFVAGGNVSSNGQLAKVQDAYNTTFPGVPFNYFFLDQEYDKQYRQEDQFRNVFMVLAGFSIMIACLGLLGLATFTVLKRKKEIGIRKVIGASTSNLVYLLSKEFMMTVVIAVAIAVPIAYLIMDSWLANFSAQVSIQWWFYALPVISVLVLVLISVGFKIIQLAISNPVNNIRTE